MNFAIIFSIIALAILFVINLAEYDVSYVKSHFDGRIHLVRNLPDRKRAANIIAELKKKFRKLIDNVSSKYKNDPIHRKGVWRLKTKFKADNIQESAPHSKYTSFSVNKGEELHLCIRPKDPKVAEKHTFHKINTLMFVGIHELAHIMSLTYGHNREFHRNFVFLLKNAVESGVYQKENYRHHKKNFCGIEINNTPLSDKYLAK